MTEPQKAYFSTLVRSIRLLGAPLRDNWWALGVVLRDSQKNSAKPERVCAFCGRPASVCDVSPCEVIQASDPRNATTERRSAHE